VKDPAVSNINDSIRRVIVCMNVLLKGASMLTSEPMLGQRQQSHGTTWLAKSKLQG